MKIGRTMSRLAAACLTVAALTPLASGATPGPCAADRERLCKDAAQTGGAALECLARHRSELSPACQTFLASKKPKRGLSVCHDDTQRLCKDVAPGEGRILKCLSQHRSELSADCQAALAKSGTARPKKTAGAQETACSADRLKFCKDVSQGGLYVIACLKKHEAELSGPCKEALSRMAAKKK